jgi:hypothetical protein
MEFEHQDSLPPANKCLNKYRQALTREWQSFEYLKETLPQFYRFMELAERGEADAMVSPSYTLHGQAWGSRYWFRLAEKATASEEPKPVKILNCPFCGEFPVVLQHYDENGYSYGYFVRCSAIPALCPALPQTIIFETPEEAIATWNIREND